MHDEIKITDLEVFANHGVFPEENTLGQKFIFTIKLYKWDYSQMIVMHCKYRNKKTTTKYW